MAQIAMSPLTPKPQKGVTLVELLVVISLIALMASFGGSALQSLVGGGSTNKAVSDLAGTLELARSFAMANNTYVRVGFHVASTSARSLPTTAVVSVYSADGSNATAMSTATWPLLSKPLFLDNFVPNSALNGTAPNTSLDEDPFSSSSSFGSLDLTLPDLGPVSFTSFVEFTPAGEARLSAGQSKRYIKIGINRARGNPSDPFILRVSGINGDIVTLRKENL